MFYTDLLRGIFIFLLSLPAHGQGGKPSARKNTAFHKEISRYALSAHTGLTQFYGELNSQHMRSMAGLALSRSFNRKLDLRLEYSFGKLGGEKREFFNSYFVNEYNTVELFAKWNLTEQFRGREKGDCDFSIYGGVGLMVFSSNAFDLDTDQLVRFTNSSLSARNLLFLRWGPPSGPVGIAKTREGILPVGMCLDYELLERWLIGLDFRFYWIRTDKADATSGQRLINPEEAESYSDTPNDKFSLLSVSITHRLGKRPRR